MVRGLTVTAVKLARMTVTVCARLAPAGILAFLPRDAYA